jgi:predicted O-linked N-acetylglucosamine transferase (SPINDLY family)
MPKPNNILVAKSTAARKAPSGKVVTQELKHPKLDEARTFASKGAYKEAAQVLEDLATTLKGTERGQVLSYAATMLKAVDNPKALTFAQQATEAAPQLTQAWMALGVVHDEAKTRKKDAIAALVQALATPAKPNQKVDIGRMLARLGEQDKGLKAVRQGYDESGAHLSVASYSLRVALQCADWELSERVIAQLRKAHAEGRTVEAGETPRTHVLWCADEATNMAVIAAFARKVYPERERLVTQAWPYDGKRRLRIAYLSSDYRDHATSLLALGLMRNHDKSRFEVYAYCTSYDDGSALRRDMLNRCDKARSISKLTDRQAADLIVKDKIDVLIDLNGLTEGTRHGVMAYHAAPVQIAYLGYPGTVGGRFVEYVIGDDYTVPEGAEKLFPEKIIRIPPTYQINDYRARYLPPAPSRQSLGLPAGRPVVGMFNNVNKVNPEVWKTWMRIFERVPQAVLWMLDPGPVAKGFLNQAAKDAGIAQERIIFAPKLKQEQHMARLRQCDVGLDPWPRGGHTTTGDALFAGLPVVALQGTNFASRVSGGLLAAAGLSGLVMPDKDRYVYKAVELLNSPEMLKKIKTYLRSKRDTLPVFDAPTRTRQLEAAYAAAHQRVLNGKATDHLRVKVGR